MAQEYLNNIQTLLNKENQITSLSLLQINKELTNIRECHDAIITCTEYQKTILDDNLDIAKIEEKKFTLENKVCNIKVALQDIIKMFEDKAKQKNIVLNLRMPEGELIVKGDIGRIKQMIINLLGNAIKFTQIGHVDIAVDTQRQTVAYTEIKFSITDSGIGMNTEEISHLFERFSQANTSIGNQYGGSGLGLLISKNLAQLMGGDIELASKKGEGTTFTCTIKCENCLKEEKDKKEENMISPFFDLPSSISKNKVLIVDDNDMNRKILRFILAKSDYECIFAMDGIEALKKFEEKPDIILMDIVMPQMDGITATKEIRKQEKENNLIHTPIIAITGNALKEQQRKAFEAGMDDYLTKPFKKEEILEKIILNLGRRLLNKNAFEEKNPTFKVQTVNINHIDKSNLLSSTLIKAPNEIFQAMLPNANEVVHFQKILILGDGNCGLTALGTDRNKFTQALLTLTTSVTARESLYLEIFQAFISNEVEAYSNQWIQLLESLTLFQSEWDTLIRTLHEKIPETQKFEAHKLKELNNWLTKNNYESLADQLKKKQLEVFQVEEALRRYCCGEEVYKYYVNAFSSEKAKLWVEHASALLFAQEMSITLYIWEAVDKNTNQLLLKGKYIASNPLSTIHLFYPIGSNHFDLLGIIESLSHQGFSNELAATFFNGH